MDLSLLPTIVAAPAIAIRAEGRIIDDASLAGGGTYSGGELLVRAAGARNGPSRTPFTALGSHGWANKAREHLWADFFANTAEKSAHKH
jgi:hypothetical protein